MSYHDIGPLSRSGIGLGSLLSPPAPPARFALFNPRHPATGPDNERVITPRWPTAVLLGRAAFPRGDYYSFYSLASERASERTRERGRFFAPAPITIPLTRPLYCPPPTPVSTTLRPDVRCIQRPHCFLPPSYSLLLLSLRPFLPLRFTFSAFLWGLSIYELSSTWMFMN